MRCSTHQARDWRSLGRSDPGKKHDDLPRGQGEAFYGPEEIEDRDEFKEQRRVFGSLKMGPMEMLEESSGNTHILPEFNG